MRPQGGKWDCENEVVCNCGAMYTPSVQAIKPAITAHALETYFVKSGLFDFIVLADPNS